MRLQSRRLIPPPAEDSVAIDKTLPSADFRRIIGFALLSGALGEFALRPAASIGIGAAVYFLLIAGAIISIAYRRSGGLPGSVRLPLLGALPFSLLLAVRDASMLTFWNLAFAIGTLALAADAVSSESTLQLTSARLRDVLRRFTRSTRHMICGAVPLVRYDAIVAFRGYSRRWYAARLVARAALLALAIASAFAALLAAGDPIFRRVFAWTVEWSPETVLLHLIGVLCWAWPAAGFLRGALKNPPAARSTTRTLGFTLGTVDAAAALAAVNAMFSLFVLVQLRVFFGGQRYVMETTGLTMAEYARQGFFVLVATSGVVVLFLLTLNALLPADSIAERPSLRRQSFVLIGLTAVVLLSALSRMMLYVAAFGLSRDRIYALAAMSWIATVLVLFGLTVLRQRAGRFALGVVFSGSLTLFVVNMVNPDVLVAGDIAGRYTQRQVADWRYLSDDLSADAVPSVVQLILRSREVPFSVLSPEYADRRSAAARLVANWGADTPKLGAAWSVSRVLAQRAVRAHEHELKRIAIE